MAEGSPVASPLRVIVLIPIRRDWPSAGELIRMLDEAIIVAVIAFRFFPNLAIPGWATYSVGALTIIFIQLVTAASSFTFASLSNRISLSFVLLRNCELFVDGFQDIYHNV